MPACAACDPGLLEPHFRRLCPPIEGDNWNAFLVTRRTARNVRPSRRVPASEALGIALESLIKGGWSPGVGAGTARLGGSTARVLRLAHRPVGRIGKPGAGWRHRALWRQNIA
jgi:hypothetical protein